MTEQMKSPNAVIAQTIQSLLEMALGNEETERLNLHLFSKIVVSELENAGFGFTSKQGGEGVVASVTIFDTKTMEYLQRPLTEKGCYSLLVNLVAPLKKDQCVYDYPFEHGKVISHNQIFGTDVQRAAIRYAQIYNLPLAIGGDV